MSGTGIGTFLRIFEKSINKTFPELYEYAHSQQHISRHCAPRGPVCAVPSSSARYSCRVFITARRRPDVAVPSNTRTCACTCRRHCMHGSHRAAVHTSSHVHDLCLAPTDMPLWAWSQHAVNECRRGIHWPIAALLARALLLAYGT
jgi:hypothetical protein